MKFIQIKSPDNLLSLECYPEIGGSIASFRADTFDLFRPYDPALPPDPLNMASFPLTPYSNRIINCEMEFERKTYHIGPPHGSEPHQLHGDGWRLPWEVREQGPHHLTIALKTHKRADSPYIYEAEQTYRLERGRLVIEMSVRNRSGLRLPFGLGHHPYFIRNDDTVLTAKLPKVWQSDKIVPQRLVDTPPEWDFSRGIALGDAHFSPPRHGTQGKDLLDHCFTGWDRAAEISWGETKLHISADPVFGNFVIYIPHGKPFFCAEAVTNVNDGFNLAAKGVADTGTTVLNDGEVLSGSMVFAVVRH